jgi:AbrB family looped-hinge helix DNA binding protein
MSPIRTKLGEGGRVIIPTAFRNSLNISQGDDIILHLSDDTIYITTPNQALRKLQAKVKNCINATGQNISLVDELLATRRSEVDYE